MSDRNIYSTYTGSGWSEFPVVACEFTSKIGGRDLKGSKNNPKNVSLFLIIQRFAPHEIVI